MRVKFFGWISELLLLSVILTGTSNAQTKPSANISGFLTLDTTWDSNIFLSHIPTFDDMYVMSNEMIIARTSIDSLGYFKFNIDFLPEKDNLYRLHLIKKDDTPATLIIGGKEENHMFLIANCYSDIHLVNNSLYPPFRYVNFTNSAVNNSFQEITRMNFAADSIASESSASKRLLIENQLRDDLLTIADTSSNFPISLFAIYKSKFDTNYTTNKKFYDSYVKKWDSEDNTYYKAFTKHFPTQNRNYSLILIGLVLVLTLAVTGLAISKRRFKSSKFEKLSIQERKIYDLLLEGATNQEISNHFNISLSTVKSHVSSIYSKLKVKSRKEIINLK